MRRVCISLWTVLCLVGLVEVAQAQWTPQVTGIDYRSFNIASPRNNNLFVTRMDRTTTSVIIDLSLANGRMGQPGSSWNTETIPSQATKYDGACGYWGRTTARYRYNVIATINGSGFSTANGFPDSAAMAGGGYAKRTFGATGTEVSGTMGFVYKLGSSAPTPGTPYMAGDISLPADPSKNRISFADSSWLQFNKLNDIPIANGISIYSHHFGARTPTTSGDDPGRQGPLVEGYVAQVQLAVGRPSREAIRPHNGG